MASVDVSGLGAPLPFAFGGQTAPNRFLKGAMSERLATWDAADKTKRGVPTAELANVYRRWGEGGWGVLLTGNVMFEYDQLESPGNPIVPRDAPFEGPRFEAFRRLAEAGKAHGSLMVAQVGHPGRQVYERVNANPISASDVQLEGVLMGQTFAKPRPMEQKDIDEVIDGFAHTAEYLYKAGFDGVELHGAHGYLLAQFLAPSTNKRTDKYGGPLLNRARIILEIADAIRARVPEKNFTLGIKINSVEFQEGGFTTDDCKELCGALEQHGFDFVELSGGTYQALGFKHARESSRRREAFFLDFADQIVPQLTKTKAYVTGGLRTVAAMVDALQTVHGVGIGRPATHEFDLPARILAGKADKAAETKLDEQDFSVTNVAAGTQMRLVGNDKAPLDLGRDDHLAAFFSSMKQWRDGLAANKDGSMFGFVDVAGTKLEPYGTPYAML